jgi:hypothetical protein
MLICESGYCIHLRKPKVEIFSAGIIYELIHQDIAEMAHRSKIFFQFVFHTAGGPLFSLFCL